MKRTLSPVVAIFFDQVGILLFYAVGLLVHERYPITQLLTWDGAIHLFGGAFPFMLANFLGWAGLMLAQRYEIGFTGLVVWGATVVVGLIFRFMNGLPVPPMFMLTSAIFLAIVLLGWRAIAIAIMSRRSRTEAQA